MEPPRIVSVVPYDLAGIAAAVEARATVLDDEHVTRTRGLYGAAEAQGLLHAMALPVGRVTGVQLRPCSTFARVCETGAVLKSHIDRAGLDWTVSLPLSALSAEWPMHVEGTGPLFVPFGSGLLLYGRGVRHWREECPAGPSSWLLLHYTIEGNAE